MSVPALLTSRASQNVTGCAESETVARGSVSGGGDAPRATGDRQQHSKTDRNDSGQRDPGARDLVEHSGLPECEEGAEKKKEVADKIDSDEHHASSLSL